MAVSVFIARRIDAPLFSNVEDGVFDAAPRPELVERHLAAPHLHIAVAVNGNRMIGMCSGVVIHHPDAPEAWWIDRIGVAPGWRGQGIAGRMVQVCTDHARRLGCREIRVAAEPADRAAAFWQRLGWVPTGGKRAIFACDLGMSP